MMFISLTLIAIGVIALLIKLGVISGSVWGYAWPVILIILGISFLGRAFSRRSGPWGFCRWWCCVLPNEKVNK